MAALKFVTLHVILFGTVYESACQSFQISKDHLNKVLVGYSVLQINGTDLHDCVRNCMSLKVCVSFNYDKRERWCQLNENESSSVDPSAFKTKMGSIYSDIKEWPSAIVKGCSSRPCQKDQRCQINGGSYVCKDITCPTEQKIANGIIEVYVPEENKPRDRATVKCKNGYTPSQQQVECQFSGQWQTASCEKLNSDCKDILNNIPGAKSGLYEIKLWRSGIILTVNCDMETDGGGWTLFQRRFDGSVNFKRTFKQYEEGFGDADGEFWIGLKYIAELAEQERTEIRLDVTNEDNETGYETYQDFRLTEGINYTLNIGSQMVSANIDEEETFLYNNQRRFTTFDRDLDQATSYCANMYGGGWWYKYCSEIFLNGIYSTAFIHYGFYNSKTRLQISSIMLRRV